MPPTTGLNNKKSPIKQSILKQKLPQIPGRPDLEIMSSDLGKFLAQVRTEQVRLRRQEREDLM